MSNDWQVTLDATHCKSHRIRLDVCVHPLVVVDLALFKQSVARRGAIDGAFALLSVPNREIQAFAGWLIVTIKRQRVFERNLRLIVRNTLHNYIVEVCPLIRRYAVVICALICCLISKRLAHSLGFKLAAHICCIDFFLLWMIYCGKC